MKKPKARIDHSRAIDCSAFGGKKTECGIIRGKVTSEVRRLEDLCPIQPFEEFKNLSSISLG